MSELARFEDGEVVAERFEILEEVGHGTTGVVYRARDLFVVDNDQELVALKAIHPHLHNDRQISGRVKREVEILKRLDDPYVCRLFEYVEEDGHMLISLEYVDGPALDEYVDRHGPLPTGEIVAIAQQICRALQVAHDGGVVHRDLKPSNVLIEGARPDTTDEDEPPPSFLRDLKVRVVDFGLSKVVAGDGGGTALTERDVIFGTPDYMSPEQAAGDDVDYRCDIYAAGVILYELVTGEVPFPRATAIATMTAHVKEAVVPPSKASDRAVPASLERVILRALDKDPSQRFPTAAAMAEALEHLDEDEKVLTEEEAPDTEDESEAAVSDTELEHAQTAIHTTLPSHEDEDEASSGRGAKVRVIVRDAPSVPPSSEQE